MRRTFQYGDARALLPAVRASTQTVVERVEPLYDTLVHAPEGSPQRRALRTKINAAVDRWADEILALGALPKGVWTVDFDSGAGYVFCWNYGEDDLAHYHLDDDGFAGRRPLTEAHKSGQSPLLLN